MVSEETNFFDKKWVRIKGPSDTQTGVIPANDFASDINPINYGIELRKP